MKRTILILAMVLPVTALAQTNDTAVDANHPVARIELDAALRTLKPGPAASGPLALPAPIFAFPQQATSTPQPPTPKAPDQGSRMRGEGSMVGYIDNAIVGSQLRVRFDAGFHTDFPDRAEFFYAKCGCYRDLVGSGLPATDPNARGPHPGVATDLNFQQLYINGEYAPNSRISAFIDLPFRWLQPKAFVPGTGNFSNQSGLGDIRVGAKVGIVDSELRHVSFQFRFDTKSGKASSGLGTGHTSIEPAVLYYERISSSFAIESEFAFWHPINGSAGVASSSSSTPESFAGNVLFYGVGPSYQLYSANNFAIRPVVELAGWHVLGGYQTVWVSPTRIGDLVKGTDVVNLKMGVRTAIGPRSSIYAGYGRALTDAVWYKDIVRIEYRYSF